MAHSSLSENPHYIYILIDPRTHAVRYVGRTVNPSLRLIQHIDEAIHFESKRKNRKNEWIRALVAAGLEPQLEVVQKVNYFDSFKCEAKWYEYYKSQNAELVNATPIERPNFANRIKRRLK